MITNFAFTFIKWKTFASKIPLLLEAYANNCCLFLMGSNMKNELLWLCCWTTLIMVAESCSKKSEPQPAVNSTTIGLYEYGTDSGKRVFVPITKVGTLALNYFSAFDTGSSGMTLDAHGVVPASMITSTGLQFTGDSTVVNGITITSAIGTISYGNQQNLTVEYGNLAYAPVTIGDQSGKANAARVPIFLYYKVVTNNVEVNVNHSLDVFGVGPGTSYASSSIPSPLIYFNSSPSLTSGFRLAVLPSAYFTGTGTYVADLLTIGLSSNDLTSSGFIMHPLQAGNVGGYSPNIPATITYSGQTIEAEVLFDTGTPLISTISNKLATTSTGQLAPNTTVTIVTNKGFRYSYITTSTTNLTAVQNPNVTGDSRTIFGIDFFMYNEILTDYVHHEIGLKNN
jgi:hypothetical protein